VSALVIDASIAVGWCFEDEATPSGDLILDQVSRHGGHVPTQWHLEVANVLWQAERRGRIAQNMTTAKLALLGQLPIRTDAETAARAWAATLALARALKLTAYDAAYVELAQRLSLPLASKDRELLAAAASTGLPVITA
jgi:predicted nucleic acid-binding protein